MRYNLDRAEFTKAFNDIIGCEFVYDIFNEDIQYTSKFAWFRNEDEYYIIDLKNGIIVNWYKHIGRCANVNVEDMAVSDLYDLFARFRNELVNNENYRW